MARPSTLHEFRNLVRNFLTWSGTQMTAPDDDWPVCMLWVQTEDGVGILEVPGFLMETGEQKDVVAAILRGTIESLPVLRFVLVMNVHGMILERDQNAEEALRRVRKGEVRLQHLPGAREALMMIYGDAEEEHHAIAFIERHEQAPPSIGAWDERPGDDWTGRFAGLNEALR